MRNVCFIFSLLLLFAISEARACSCNLPGTIEERVAQSDAIFLGYPLSTRWVIDTSDGFRFWKSTKFAVHEVIKGNIKTRNDEDPNVGYIYVRHGGGSPASCGSSFGRGIAYEVFAIERENRFYSGPCNLTRPAPIPEYEYSWEDYRNAASQEQE